jgi:hypothetical protein
MTRVPFQDRPPHTERVNAYDEQHLAIYLRLLMAEGLVDLSGDYQTTIYDAARRLLAAGADPSHTLETRRAGHLSKSGKIGELAKWRVVFASTGPRLERYKDRPPAPPAAKTTDGPIIHRPSPPKPFLEALTHDR